MVQKYFASETYETGDRVPSERKIADDLQVNRTTLRTALQRMVKHGLLERQVGVGTFFKISPKEMADNYAKISTKCSAIELLETRIIFEPQIATIAALNIATNHLNILKEICAVGDAITLLELEKADILFHDNLAEISGNLILAQIYNVVSEIRKKMLGKKEMEARGEVCRSTFECLHKWKTHQGNIIIALEKKDSKAAGNAVREKLSCILGQHSLVS